MNERSITSTTGTDEQSANLERCLSDKASAGRQINNFNLMLHKLVDSKAHAAGDMNALLLLLQKQRILEIGPGDKTYILDFLVQDLHFIPGNLYAVDPTLKCDPGDARIKSGQYKRGRIENINGEWPKEHFGFIFGFHVLGKLLIKPTSLLADQLYGLLSPKGLLALSSTNKASPDPLIQRFGKPVAAYKPNDLLIFSKSNP